ncbi:acyl-CoA dehydrogenase [Agrobacterium sp. S2]|nr:acyl-CoA dehydrogenase [Agrobacterium sp. S2]
MTIVDHKTIRAPQVVQDIYSVGAMKRLDAALDTSSFSGRPRLPWHWFHFLPETPTRDLSRDGHPIRDDALAAEFPRRMWAGSRIAVLGPSPRPGEAITRTTETISQVRKKGGSGSLFFVTLLHRISGEAGLLIQEEQDIVYRQSSARCNVEISGQPAKFNPEWHREVNPSPSLLFRFSSLTFNTHRIHYDRNYAQDVEGYPGLVVHGPLQAALLLDLFYRTVPGYQVRTFSFRSRHPVFDNGLFKLCASLGAAPGELNLWTQDGSGCVGSQARVIFDPDMEE